MRKRDQASPNKRLRSEEFLPLLDRRDLGGEDLVELRQGLCLPGRLVDAERLNGKRYHPEWLQNLLVSASLGGYRKPPRKAG